MTQGKFLPRKRKIVSGGSVSPNANRRDKKPPGPIASRTVHPRPPKSACIRFGCRTSPGELTPKPRPVSLALMKRTDTAAVFQWRQANRSPTPAPCPPPCLSVFANFNYGEEFFVVESRRRGPARDIL